MPAYIYIHTGLVRIRALGSGNLDMELFGYDEIETKTILPVALAATEKKQRDRLTTFVSQATKVKVSMDVINEYFRVDALTIFIRPQWSSAPLVD